MKTLIISLMLVAAVAGIARIEKRSEMDFMNPDGNDVITRAEANFFFNFMDRNGDNVVTNEEVARANSVMYPGVTFSEDKYKKGWLPQVAYTRAKFFRDFDEQAGDDDVIHLSGFGFEERN